MSARRRAAQIAVLALPLAVALGAAWSLLGDDGPEEAPLTPGTSRGADDFGDPLPPFAVRRFGSTRLRPGTHAVALSSDGAKLLSGHEDGRVRVWDVATGAVERTIDTNLDHVAPRARDFEDVIENAFESSPKGPDPVQLVVTSPDGRWFATHVPGCVRVFDLVTGAQRAEWRFTERSDPWTSGFTSDGTKLLVSDGRWLVWDFTSGKDPAPAPGAGPRIDPTHLGATADVVDGRAVLADDRSRLDDWRIVDLSDGTTTAVRAPGVEPSRAVPAPRGHALVAWHRYTAPAWRLRIAGPDGRERFPEIDVPQGGSVPVWLPDASAVLLGTNEGLLRIDAATGARKVLVPAPTVVLGGAPRGGRVLVHCHGAVRVIDAATGRDVRSAVSGDAITGFAWSPARESLALTCADGTTVVRDAATGRIEAGPLPSSAWGSAAFGADGTHVAVQRPGAIAVVDLATGAEQIYAQEPLVTPFALAGDVPVWRVDPAPVAVVVRGRRRAATGATAATGAAATAQPSAPPVTAASLRRGTDGSLIPLDATRGILNAASFTADGRRVIGQDASWRLTAWDTSDGRIVGQTTEPSWSGSFAVSPNGTHAAYFLGELRVALIGSGAPPVEIPQPGRNRWEGALAVTNDGRFVARALPDGVILIVRARRPDETARVRGHLGAVERLAFSFGGGFLASQGADRTVVVWDVTAALMAAKGDRRIPDDPDGR